MVKHLVKSLMKAVAPTQYTSLMASRENRHGQKIMTKYGVPGIAKAVTERYGATIQGGPFAGMVYITRSAGSSLVPKLIGSYECELEGVLAHVLATEYDTVVDVGSAEGYYAVGFAMRLPGSPRIYAFDVNPEAQALCKELAQQNGVEARVIIKGACDAARLQATLHGKSLVMCDCEGYEVELLQPALAPALNTAEILVELHDCLKPGITPLLLERFKSSHDIRLIDSTDRAPSDYPLIHFLTAEQQQVAVSEFRHGPQQWAFMTPKTS